MYPCIVCDCVLIGQCVCGSVCVCVGGGRGCVWKLTMKGRVAHCSFSI